MMSFLSLWRNPQPPIKALKSTSHWALVYEERDSDFPDEVNMTYFHIANNDNGKPAKFECCTVDLDRWSKSEKDIREVGPISISKSDFERTCRRVSRDFIFRAINHNCQNWCNEVLKEINMESPIKPSNEETCGCLYMISLSTISSSILPDKYQS
jgi:hypothetical protein